MTEEMLPLVDEDGRPCGVAPRRVCHGDPRLLHPVVHCLVANARGELLLQLRARSKDIQPGKWDTSVGGHVDPGETIETALRRELAEEIGLADSALQPEFLYRYINRSPVESELVHTFRLTHEGPFRAQPEEIEELRFWTPEAITAAAASGDFTPNFLDEFARFREWRKRREG